MADEVLNAEAAENGITDPAAIHNCPSCEVWLGDGETLACPECQTLVYGQHVATLAQAAHTEQQQGHFAAARELWLRALQWLPPETQQAATLRTHVEQLTQRMELEQQREAKWKKRLGPLAPVALFLFKAKSAIFILFKAKFLLGFLSFFGFYWLLFGWKFALGFAISLLIHEMGHFITLKRRGYQPELPILIPFVGGYVRWFSNGVSREELAAVSLAGPLYGLFAAIACLLLWKLFGLPVFLVLANVGAWINLFNLLPIGGLDGSKAVYALGYLQRLLLASICFLFFGLTVYASGGHFFSPTTQWMFAIVGAGLLWRCYTHDAPEEPHTGTMIYFAGLLLALGIMLLVTLAPVNLLTS
ncbi:site-2 protease family protein [Granulicella cerasi]|uniref:Site-2 protease family protein n=1 Tax=Granulicella cerasi TaxID=741063 RepID=A0ABW1ZAF9_9BACT|nr:site-2 protease family protein [Granulicella cerasi]